MRSIESKYKEIDGQDLHHDEVAVAKNVQVRSQNKDLSLRELINLIRARLSENNTPPSPPQLESNSGPEASARNLEMEEKTTRCCSYVEPFAPSQ